MNKWSSKRFANCYCYERHGRIWVSLFGQKYRRSLKLLWTLENKELALKRLDYIAEHFSQKDYEKPEDLTLEDLIEQFRESKYITIDKQYKDRFERVFNRYLTERDMLLSQTDYIESMISNNVRITLEGKLHTKNGVKKGLEYLGQLFNYGLKRGRISVNPARLVSDNIKAQTIDRDAMPYKNYTIIVNEFKRLNKHQEAHLVELIYHTGMRISEALAIRRKDIDFSNNILTIRGKGNILRTFPLAGRFKIVRTLLFEIYNKEYHNNKLFYWKYPETPQLKVRKIQKKFGIYKKGLNFHAIRKLFINKLIDENYPLRSTAELVGHTVQIMEKHYLKRQSAKTQSDIAEKHENNTK